MRVAPWGNHPPLLWVPLAELSGTATRKPARLYLAAHPCLLRLRLHRGPRRLCPWFMEIDQTVRPMVSTIRGIPPCRWPTWAPISSHRTTSDKWTSTCSCASPNNLSLIPCHSLGTNPPPRPSSPPRRKGPPPHRRSRRPRRSAALGGANRPHFQSSPPVLPYPSPGPRRQTPGRDSYPPCLICLARTSH